jgi:arginyl-tRNA synthetase
MLESELAELTLTVRRSFERAGIAAPVSMEWVPVPFAGRWGVGTAACFQVAATEAKAGKKVHVPSRAREIAQQVASSVVAPFPFVSVIAEDAYLNAYFDTAQFAERVVDTAIGKAEDFGRGSPKAEKVMVEYAQPNTHHSFHIGHARNAILGEAVARLTEFSGFQTIRASYPGDIGLGVITCIWGYRRFHQGQEPTGVQQRGRWLAGIYTEATSLLAPRAEETPKDVARRQEYEAEVRELYRRWDSGDPGARALWETTRQWSLDELDEILKMLDIQIDVFFFESEVDKPSKEIVHELIDRGIADDERASGGPVVVKIDEKLGLKKEKYRTAVVLRNDGTTLYSTKDLALAKVKFEKYHVDRSIYVVDVRQSLHFQQVFKILELWGFPQASKCVHLAYGFVTLPEGAMSSRRGNVVYFTDLADEAHRRVLKVIEEKNPGMAPEKRDEVARIVGLGALAYAFLSVDTTKDIVFDWESALSFDGQTAPYIQNAHVRANSILRKGGDLPPAARFDYALEPTEITLIDLISRFPATAERAVAELRPIEIANYAYELARAFHSFYHAVPVLQSGSPAVRDARLRLTAATRQTLANSLRLLVIRSPEVM